MVLKRGDPSLERALKNARKKGNKRAEKKLLRQSTPNTSKSVAGKVTRLTPEQRKKFVQSSQSKQGEARLQPEPINKEQLGPRKSLLEEKGGIPVPTGSEEIKAKTGIFEKIAEINEALSPAAKLRAQGIDVQTGVAPLIGGFGAGKMVQTTKGIHKVVKIAPKVGKVIPKITGSTKNVLKNTKSMKLVTDAVGKIIKRQGKGVIAFEVALAAIGSYAWNGHLTVDNLIGGLGIAAGDAFRDGNMEAYQQLSAEYNEALDEGLFNDLWDFMPGVNVIHTSLEIVGGAQASKKIYDKLVDDKINQDSSGQSDADYWKERDAERTQQEQDLILFYNEQRKLQVLWEQEAANDDRNADARFWASERAKQRKKEEEDRKAIAAFWEEYKRRNQEIADNNRPSKLGFGLL